MSLVTPRVDRLGGLSAANGWWKSGQETSAREVETKARQCVAPASLVQRKARGRHSMKWGKRDGGMTCPRQGACAYTGCMPKPGGLRCKRSPLASQQAGRPGPFASPLAKLPGPCTMAALHRRADVKQWHCMLRAPAGGAACRPADRRLQWTGQREQCMSVAAAL